MILKQIVRGIVFSFFDENYGRICIDYELGDEKSGIT